MMRIIGNEPNRPHLGCDDMWHTPTGNRVIRGAEAELIRASVGGIVEELLRAEHLHDDNGFDSGIEIFDALPVSQKLASLEQVMRYLLTDTLAPLPLTAVNEAVVGVIFENVRQQVEMEVMRQDPYRDDWFSQEAEDEEPWRLQLRWSDESGDGVEPFDYRWREWVLAAAAQVRDSGLRDQGDCEALCSEEWPTRGCTDIHAWDILIECLADCILWDRDYEMAEAFLDDDPEHATAKKNMLGIHPDYFTGLAPDPRDEELGTVVDSIEQLMRAKPR